MAPAAPGGRRKARARAWLRAGRRAGLTALAVAGMAVPVLWLSGVFEPKVPPGPPQPVLGPAPDAPTLTVRARDVPVVEQAVGTIEAVQEVRLSARILARIRKLHVELAGTPVEQGQVLVELEDDDLRAAVERAEADLRSAEETLAQARRDLARTEELHRQEIASLESLERDRTRAQNSLAARDAAAQALAAARANLDYATIRSPITGLVIDKHVVEGDTVAPGQLLMTLYDPDRMQLVAGVREELATLMKVGGTVEVRIDALGLTCHGTVHQIVPRAEAGSRAFDVKVTGPCPEGVYTGMFGRLILPVGTRKEIRVPASAVRAIGQVDLVFAVLPEGVVLRRFVRTGAREAGEVEILSGLREGEIILERAEDVRTR